MFDYVNNAQYKNLPFGQVLISIAIESMLFSHNLVNFNHNGALHAFSEQLATGLVNTLYRAAGMVRVSGTSAGAVKFRPAVFAIRP